MCVRPFACVARVYARGAGARASGCGLQAANGGLGAPLMAAVMNAPNAVASSSGSGSGSGSGAGSGSGSGSAAGSTSVSGSDKWYFTRDQLANSPSRQCGLDADKELAYRQQAANLIQDMGQRLQVYPFLMIACDFASGTIKEFSAETTTNSCLVMYAHNRNRRRPFDVY